MPRLSTSPTAHPGRIIRSSAARASRFSGTICLLSRAAPSTWPQRPAASRSRTAQAATTGPAQAPRPASSTPPQAMPGGMLPRSQSRRFTAGRRREGLAGPGAEGLALGGAGLGVGADLDGPVRVLLQGEVVGPHPAPLRRQDLHRSPGARSPRRRWTSEAVAVRHPSTARTAAPKPRPARAAGEPGWTLATSGASPANTSPA